MTIVKGNPKAPFSIATTPRCRGGRNSFPWIAPFYPWSIPYNAECKARRHQVPFFESLVWLNLGLNPQQFFCVFYNVCKLTFGIFILKLWLISTLFLTKPLFMFLFSRPLFFSSIHFWRLWDIFSTYFFVII